MDESYASPGPPHCTCDVEEVRIVEVIHVRLVRGLGTSDDKCRWVQQWWTKEGRLIAENDPFDCQYDARIMRRADSASGES